MNPVPTITKNSPLKIDQIQEDYQESSIEKRSRLIFWLGVVFFVVITLATFGIYALWVRT